MGNFEKLSVLVIVVIIVMILIVAIYTWTDNPDNSATVGPAEAAIEDEGGGDRGFSGPIDPNKPKDARTSWDDIFRPKDPEPIGHSKTDPKADPKSDPKAAPGPAPKPSEPKKPVEPKKPSDLTAREPWTYVIKSGDSLSVIAQRELGTIHRQGEMTDLNPGLDALRLRIGQELKMPPRGTVGTKPVKTDDGAGTTPVRTTPTAGAGRPSAGSWYVTRRGDTLEKISKAAFRSIDYWPEIWAKNLKALPRLEDMGPGLRLFIPKVQKFQ